VEPELLDKGESTQRYLGKRFSLMLTCLSNKNSALKNIRRNTDILVPIMAYLKKTYLAAFAVFPALF
jgi:hypothetical protein